MKKKIPQKELIEATNFIFDNFKKKDQRKIITHDKAKPLLLTKKVKIVAKRKITKKNEKKLAKRKIYSKKVYSKNDILLLNNIIKYQNENEKILFLSNIVGKNIKFTFLKKSAWESKK